MKELEQYVDKMFKNYRKIESTRELRDEVLSNLEAKAEDYIQNGMSKEEAIRCATKNIDNIDTIMDGNVTIYSKDYKIQLCQSALIYFIVVWILTIPLRINLYGMMVNNLFILITIAALIIYISLLHNKTSEIQKDTRAVNILKLLRIKKAAWFIWVAYIIVVTAYTTALRFGSNIWFHRRIHIDGPYQFAVIVLDYLLPFITIVIPMLFNKAWNLIYKCEVKE